MKFEAASSPAVRIFQRSLSAGARSGSMATTSPRQGSSPLHRTTFSATASDVASTVGSTVSHQSQRSSGSGGSGTGSSGSPHASIAEAATMEEATFQEAKLFLLIEEGQNVRYLFPIFNKKIENLGK